MLKSLDFSREVSRDSLKNYKQIRVELPLDKGGFGLGGPQNTTHISFLFIYISLDFKEGTANQPVIICMQINYFIELPVANENVNCNSRSILAQGTDGCFSVISHQLPRPANSF